MGEGLKENGKIRRFCAKRKEERDRDTERERECADEDADMHHRRLYSPLLPPDPKRSRPTADIVGANGQTGELLPDDFPP